MTDQPRTEAELDVDRLSKAMEAACNLVYHGSDDPVDWHAEAIAIAAEYSRRVPESEEPA